MASSLFGQLIEAQRRFQYQLLAKANVVGVAIGYKNAFGEPSDELAIVALVDRKKPDAALHDSDKIPPEIQGVKTDVIETGQFYAQQTAPNTGARSAWRPVIPGGVSIGHYKVTAGTLGVMVRDRLTGAYLLLSNNHVLANSNDALIGDPILQPAPTDRGINPQDVVARLERFVPLAYVGDPVSAPAPVQPPPPAPVQPPAPAPIQPSEPVQPPPPAPVQPSEPSTPTPSPVQPPAPVPPPASSRCDIADAVVTLGNVLAALNGSDKRLSAMSVSAQSAPPSPVYATSVSAQMAIAENSVDCAVAKPLNVTMFSNEIRYIGRISGVLSPSLNARVRKVGRTTDYTEGTITLVNATVDVGYNTATGPRTARFVGQVITSGMSMGGDSGSLVVDISTGQAVGLLFAGSGTASIFTPIQRVLDALSVTF
jgi:hypothetical protein